MELEGFRQKSVTDDRRMSVGDRDDATDHREQEETDTVTERLVNG